MVVAGSVLPGAVGASSMSAQNGGYATMGAARWGKWAGALLAASTALATLVNLLAGRF